MSDSPTISMITLNMNVFSNLIKKDYRIGFKKQKTKSNYLLVEDIKYFILKDTSKLKVNR